MTSPLLEMSLFGPCLIRSARPDGYSITGVKHRALLALLATAPFGRRTRSFLQTTLWGTTCYDTGRQSLRRALSDIKQQMGDEYTELLDATHGDITLDLRKVRFLGRIEDGIFLEGIDVREKGFSAWAEGIRANPDQIGGLYVSSRALRSPVQPVVAVLPFTALGADPVDAALGDWFAEQVCRSLGRSRLIAVISHLSGREFVRQTIDIAAVRAKLRTDYCVNGSLHRVGGAIVLDTDLIDTASGQLLWTEQFHIPADKFMERAADFVQIVLSRVATSIADEALRHVRDQEPARIDGHRLLIAGVALMHRLTLHEFAYSRTLIEEALRRAPYAAEIHAWLGKWYVLSVFNGFSSESDREIGLALASTARGLELEPDNAFCLTIDGFAQTNLKKRLDLSAARYDLAIDTTPSCAIAWLLKGVLHAFQDEGVKAVEATERARRLSPLDPFGYFYDSLTTAAYLAVEDYESALEYADRSLSLNDRHIPTLRAKIAALHYLDRGEEALGAGRELMRRQPGFTLDDYCRTHPAAACETGQRMVRALRAAGVP